MSEHTPNMPEFKPLEQSIYNAAINFAQQSADARYIAYPTTGHQENVSVLVRAGTTGGSSSVIVQVTRFAPWDNLYHPDTHVRAEVLTPTGGCMGVYAIQEKTGALHWDDWFLSRVDDSFFQEWKRTGGAHHPLMPNKDRLSPDQLQVLHTNISSELTRTDFEATEAAVAYLQRMGAQLPERIDMSRNRPAGFREWVRGVIARWIWDH